MGLVRQDYDFGTFNFKGDSSMTFFLIMIITFLLFDYKRNHIVKHRTWVILWLSATVLIANSEMSKLILLLVWVVYLVTHIRYRVTVLVLASLLITGTMLLASGLLFDFLDNTIRTVKHAQVGLSGDVGAVERYLQGEYNRGGAIYYYLNNSILWFGDGPTAYSDPITRDRVRGNVGHAFTFYSEIGIIGWMLSIMVFFLIAFRPDRGRLRMNYVSILIFISVQLLGLVNQIMNDISIVLIYCLIAKSYLIPTRAYDYEKYTN
jgi:hypothetical protein